MQKKELPQITPALLQCLSNGLQRTLTNVDRTYDGHMQQMAFNEFAKQSLNAFIAFHWTLEANECGFDVQLPIMVRLILERCLVKELKTDVCHMTLDKIFKVGNIPASAFSSLASQKLAEAGILDFADFIKCNPHSVEARIFQASTTLGTLVELESARNFIPFRVYLQKKMEIWKELRSLTKRLPAARKILYSRNYWCIFEAFSNLRFRVRWAKCHKLSPQSDLSHSLGVAIWAYLHSLELEPNDEEKATQLFFNGLLHDYAEAWTGDIPSPIKDSIHGMRAASEQVELQAYESQYYARLPKYIRPVLENYIMEAPVNANSKVFMKLNDYCSALWECTFEISIGNKDCYYYEVVMRDLIKYKKTNVFPPAFWEFIQSMCMFEIYSQLSIWEKQAEEFKKFGIPMNPEREKLLAFYQEFKQLFFQ